MAATLEEVQALSNAASCLACLNETQLSAVAAHLLQQIAENPGVSTHDLLSLVHPDTVPGPPVKGSIVVGNSMPKWEAFPVGLDGLVLGADSTEPFGVKWVSNSAFPGFAAPSTLVSLSSSAGVAATALRSDAGLALSQSIAPTWTSDHTFNARIIVAESAVVNIGAAGVSLRFTSGAMDILETTPGDPIVRFRAGSDHIRIGRDFPVSWSSAANPASAASDTWIYRQSAAVVRVENVLSAVTGFRVNNLAASGEYLRGNGTNFVSSTIQSGDLPGGFSGFAAPSTQVTLSSSAGVATTGLRSDAGLALSQAIAPTWTAAHIWDPPDNITPITITDFDVTGANAQPAISIVGEFNTTGAPAAIKALIADTASNVGLFLDMRTVGGKYFLVDVAGSASFSGSTWDFGAAGNANQTFKFARPAAAGSATIDLDNIGGTANLYILRRYRDSPFRMELASGESLDVVIDSNASGTTSLFRILRDAINNAGTVLFTIAESGLVTVTNKVTGLTQATAATDAVAGARLISAGTGLTGGGDLTADRTISLSVPVVISSGGTNSIAALNNNRIMVSSGGAIVEAAALTNGQLLIGSTGAAPVAAGLTAGANISITPGAGSITIAATGVVTQAYSTIQEEGAGLTQRSILNFIGGGFTAADDAGNSRTNLTLDATLNALAAFNTDGFLVQTAADTFAGRTFADSSEIAWTNPAGTAGNPSASIVAGSLANSKLSNSTISFTDGAGIGGSGSPTALGGTYTTSSTSATPRFAAMGLGAASPSAGLLVSISDAATNSSTTITTLQHNSTGTAAAGFAGRLLWQLESSTTNDQDAAAIEAQWTTATHASRTGVLCFLTVTGAAAIAETARLGQGLMVGTTPTDPGSGVIKASTGFRIADSPTAGKILISDGTNFVASSPTYPNSASSTGTILRADGTNWVTSTLTFPNASAQGDIFYSTTANAMTVLAKNTTATRYLSNTGPSNDPAWEQVNLANGVTGDLPFANIAQIATGTVLGRITAGTGDIEVLTRIGLKATGTGFTNIGQLSDNSNFSGIAFTTAVAQVTGTNYSLLGEGTNTYLNAPSGGSVFHRIANTTMMTLNASGFGIGAAPVSTALFYVDKRYNNDPTFNQNGSEYFTRLTLTANEGTFATRGSLFTLEKTGAFDLTTTPGGLRAFQMQVINQSGTGAVSSIIAMMSSVQNNGGAGTGTVTEAIHYYADLPSGAATSPITNVYAFFAKSQRLAAGGTNSYGFYSEGTQDISYIAGFLGIGTNAPGARLHLPAGTATAGTGPLQFSAGTLLSVAVAGSMEFGSSGANTDGLYFTETTSTNRHLVAYQDNPIGNQVFS